MNNALAPSSRVSYAMRERFHAVRGRSMALAAPLSAEDQQIQSMPDVSPTKWHLAHITWFFETFVLLPNLPEYSVFHPGFCRLFNSYYETVGARTPRHQRGLISRPGLTEIHAYRAHVDAAMERLLTVAVGSEVAALVELGLQHEQQHQELTLMDIKHVLACNPLEPAYDPDCAPRAPAAVATPLQFVEFGGGLRAIGHHGGGFCFDNELPRHSVWLEPFSLADRLVTVGDYLAFIEAGGYRDPRLWLSDGWATVQGQGWTSPLYWRCEDSSVFTLSGRRPLVASEPVLHVSYYEADAYARWAGKRLPTEAEWEVASESVPADGHFAEAEQFHPRAALGDGLRQMFGDCWEFTQSPYTPYPGFRADEGAIGEYNGKFMVNQIVLRGGACITPESHMRRSYRNFFPAAARWMFGGIRLAE